MRLLLDTQLNQYQYRLIDSCSLSSDLCPMIGGSGARYIYEFNLSKAKTNAVFSGQLQGDQPLLDPGQVAFISLYFLSSENLIYSVAPEITVALADEQRTFTLSQINNTLAFAKRDQFSCYQLHGNTFTQKVISTSWGWCM